MDATIEQQLARGMRAQKAGDLAEAQDCYRSILQAHPNHPQANHCIGTIAVTSGQLTVAIKSFRLALEGRPEIEDYWVSLIDALIRQGQIEAARVAFETGSRSGVIIKSSSSLQARLGAHVERENLTNSRDVIFSNAESTRYEDEVRRRRSVDSVLAHYHRVSETALSLASRGWLFADSFDRHFFSGNSAESTLAPNKRTLILGQKYPSNFSEVSHLSQIEPAAALNELTSQTDTSRRYELLGELVSNSRGNIVEDSFIGHTGISLPAAAQRALQGGALRVVIIGGGPCGLYLASLLKANLRSQANVLVLDNRSSAPNLREPFNRKWLTHIPSLSFSTPAHESIFPLLTSFGADGLVGLPISYLEGILQLFCKTLGVKFFFSPELDFSSLADETVDLLFDASGGRLTAGTYVASAADEYNAKIPAADIVFNQAGVSQLFNLTGETTEPIDFTLKREGDFYFPYREGIGIKNNMVKVTGIPPNTLAEALQLVKKFNPNNRFYIWKGSLKEEINEGLILANLTPAESDYLRQHLTEPTEVSAFLNGPSSHFSQLNDNITSMLHFLSGKDPNSGIRIEPAFHYAPSVNLNAASGRLRGKRVFPVGDSLFVGHPKMGNGLTCHLELIAQLQSVINQSISQ